MRVTFATCDEFCAEIERLEDIIWRKEVRVRIDRAPEQDDEITFLIGIWGTAMCRAEDGDFLLEYGELCGTDDTRKGSRAPNAGSDAAAIKRGMIAAVCEKSGLLLLPGKTEVY